MAKTGPVSYRVEVSGQIWRRHCDQLLSRGSDENWEAELSSTDEWTAVDSPEVVPYTGGLADHEEEPVVLESSKHSLNTGEASSATATEPVPLQSPSSPKPTDSTEHTSSSTPKRYPQRVRKVSDRLAHKY